MLQIISLPNMKNFNSYKTISEKLSKLNIDSSYIFTKELFDGELKNIQVANLILRKSKRSIHLGTDKDFPFEINIVHGAIEWLTYKDVYLNFGILLFDLLFSKNAYATINITQANSQIKTIYFYLDRKKNDIVFLETAQNEAYKSYEFIPSKISKFPFSSFGSDAIKTDDAPAFYYGWSDSKNTDKTQKADQLIITLNVVNLCKLAELFLNIGNKENNLDEICLENSIDGFGGVWHNSLESRFWLPNSLYFYSDDIDDMRFQNEKD